MEPSGEPNSRTLSRREFVGKSAVAISALAGYSGPLAALASESAFPPIAVFTKAYQPLKLDFESAAEVTAAAGLDGIDCPVRPAGEILPEHAADELPRYAEVLRKHNLQLPLLTTAITTTASPFAETIVRTAKKAGAQFYRLGFIDRQTNVEQQIREVKAALKDLAALNKTVGIGALIQNHSPSGHTYLGGNLGELHELVRDFDPAQIGAAFDIGHALIVHREDWRAYFEKLKPHFKVAYIKDAKKEGGWVPFGQGDVGTSGYFKLLKEINYRAPVSLHLEFDWSQKGKSKDKATLIKSLKDSLGTLKHWLKEAR